MSIIDYDTPIDESTIELDIFDNSITPIFKNTLADDYADYCNYDIISDLYSRSLFNRIKEMSVKTDTLLNLYELCLGNKIIKQSNIEYNDITNGYRDITYNLTHLNNITVLKINNFETDISTYLDDSRYSIFDTVYDDLLYTQTDV